MNKIISEEKSPKGSSLLEQMREGRRSSPAVYMKFTQYSEHYPSHAFCFYEGEDGYYYDRRIEENLEDGDNFITLIAGNKNKVLMGLNIPAGKRAEPARTDARIPRRQSM